jgi:primary-amine oxidase
VSRNERLDDELWRSPADASVALIFSMPTETTMNPSLARTRSYLCITLLGLAATGLSLCCSGQVDSQEKQAVPDAGDGRNVEWEGWKFAWAVRPLEGLVLTDVHFHGRLVLKYAGIAELFTPYDQGGPRPLDLLQNGLGEPKAPVVAGIDCSSGEWCKVYDIKGRPPAKGAPAMVMMHEERTGPNYLGKYGRVPGKTLVLWSAGRFAGGLDGYTFVVRWKFRNDGTLIPEIGATGVPQHLSTGDSSPFGSFIGFNKTKQKVFAPSHVHNFLYRLDFAIDGEENTVEEFNWERDKTAPGKARCTWTKIVKETGRPCNAETFRSWRVVNYQSKNALGHPRSYQLLPGSTGLFRGNASEKEKSTHADFWVTRYKPDERPRTDKDRRTAMEALAKYADGESVENQPLVVWYWLCVHHMPRTEDWQLQPMVWKSFELMPRDFLDASPLKRAK